MGSPVKISQLPAAIASAAGDLFAVVQASTTRHVALSQLYAYVAAFFSASGGSSLVGYIAAWAGSVVRTVQDRLRDTTFATDIGIVPSDNTKRAANTAAIAAFWAAGGSDLAFRATGETYYFESWTLPNQVVSIHSSGVMRVNNPCILDFAPTGTVAISAPYGTEQGRHSRIQGLSITTGLTNTAIKVDQGGLTLLDLHVNQSNIALHITQSYGASYDRLTLQGATKGLYADGATVAGPGPGALFNNKFGVIAVNTTPGGIAAGSKGVHIAASVSGNISENTFLSIDFSRCDTGWYAEAAGGVILQNIIHSAYHEAVVTRAIDYSNALASTDRFGEIYVGNVPANGDNYSSKMGLDDNQSIIRNYLQLGPADKLQGVPAALANTRNIQWDETASRILDAKTTKNGNNRYHWKTSMVITGTVTTTIAKVVAAGSDGGYGTAFHVQAFAVHIGQFMIEEGVALSVGTGLTNAISVAMTTLRSATLGNGTLAWSASPGDANLNYTPPANADLTFVEITIANSKNDPATPYGV